MKEYKFLIKHIERYYDPRDIDYCDILTLSKLFNTNGKIIAKLIDYRFKLGFKCSNIFKLHTDDFYNHNVVSVYCGYNLKSHNKGFYKNGYVNHNK